MKKFFTVFVVLIVAVSTAASFFGGSFVRRRAQVNSAPTTETEASTPQPATQQPATEEKVVAENPAPNQVKPTTVNVNYTQDGFLPNTVTVSPGTTVTFTNQTSDKMWVASNPHPAHTTLKEFDADRGFGSGESYAFTFTTPGTWKYHDHLRPSRGGVVVVR